MGRPASEERNGEIRRTTLILTAAVALYLLLFSSTSTALRPATTIDPCILYSDSPVSVKQFIGAVWDEDRWRRGDPPAKTIAAWRLKLHCLPPSWQKKLKQRWRELRAEFFHRRRAELWRERITPYYGCTSIGGCGWWALPVAVTDCESGGYYGHHSGAYGFLDSTWSARGGSQYGPYPGAASESAQDLMAHQLWVDVGPSGWECPL